MPTNSFRDIGSRLLGASGEMYVRCNAESAAFRQRLVWLVWFGGLYICGLSGHLRLVWIFSPRMNGQTIIEFVFYFPYNLLFSYPFDYNQQIDCVRSQRLEHFFSKKKI